MSNSAKITRSFENVLLGILTLALTGFYFGIAVPPIALWFGFLLILGYAILYRRKETLSFLFSPRVKSLISSPLFLLGVATLVSFGVSSFFGIQPDESIFKWVSVCAISVAGLTWYLGLRTFSPITVTSLPRYIYIALAILSSVYLTESVIFKTTGYTWHSERFLLTMRKLASIYAILVPFALLYVLKKDKPLYWFGLTLFAITVFFCGGRSGILAFVFMALLFAFFFPWGSVARWGRSLFLYTASIFSGAAVGTAGYLMMVGEDSFTSRIASPRAATGSGRTEIWQFSWNHISEHPVFGIGVQGFRYLDFTGSTLSSTAHPHNIILEIILETGFVGASLLALFVIAAFYKTVRFAHRKILTDHSGLRPLLMASAVSFCAYLVAAQFVTSFFHGWWLTYPTLLAALIGALTHVYRKAEANPPAVANGQFPVTVSPTVSIVMPCHNGADFIGAAIASVKAQTLADWELLITDDGSTDRSAEIIKAHAEEDSRIVYLNHETAQGAGAARNTSLSAARGRYIAFLDCDDLWAPRKLEQQIAEMTKHGAALSTTYYDVIDDQSRVVGSVRPRDHVLTFGRLLKCNDIGCSFAILDRAHIKQDLQFPLYERAQDFVFWCTILRQGYLCLCLHKPLGSYRVHAKSRTSNKLQTALNRISLLNKAIGVPYIVMPYYILLYVVYGLLKQKRSRKGD